MVIGREASMKTCECDCFECSVKRHDICRRRKDMSESEVRSHLANLDGTVPAAVSLLTGLSLDELDELGGFSDGCSNGG